MVNALLKSLSNNRLIRVDAEDRKGKTALMYAIERNNIKVIELLLNAGLNIKKVTKTGKSALTIAEETNHETLIFMLANKSMQIKCA